MKRQVLSIIAAGCVLAACDTPYFPSPNVPGAGADSRTINAPDDVTATQGEKGYIELSWNEVPRADSYRVFKTESLLLPFSNCGVTGRNQIRFDDNIPAGSVIYYRIVAIAPDGSMSSLSLPVEGTTLAQPYINEIIDVTEESATVAWGMKNAEYYRNELQYIVTCFDGANEVDRIEVDGTKDRVTFRNLAANTKYSYRVEAHLSGKPNAREDSGLVNKETLRRTKPGAPKKLRASRGTAKDKIELTFELPDKVDIVLGADEYDSKPVYFVISKRRASGTSGYQIVCRYFGSNAVTAAARGGKSFPDYQQGKEVTWTDDIARGDRGVEYQYQVQAYVDDGAQEKTADDSKAATNENETGWALSEGSLSVDDLEYTANEKEDEYIKAKLWLKFDFADKGVTYEYALVETIEPIDDNDPNDPNGTITRTEISTFSYNAIKKYAAEKNLTQKTTEATPGRGLYSYAVGIKLDGKTIDTVETIGNVEVSELIEKILVEGFNVLDGYKDRFVFKWQYREDRKYVLYESNDGKTGWTEIYSVNDTPDNTNSAVKNYEYTYKAGVTTGMNKYFAIRAFRYKDGILKQGQMAYAPAGISQTLGVPVLSLGAEPSYTTITAAWKPAQKADAYRIKYWYTCEGSYASAKTVDVTNLTTDAYGNITCPFIPFENNTVEAAKAGKEIQVAVDAVNAALSATAGIGEIATSSQGTPAAKRLVGPAELNPSASKAVSPTQIEVSWNRIEGAAGYYVFRRQFDMNNSAEKGIKPIAYYVTVKDGAPAVTGKSIALDNYGVEIDTDTNGVTAVPSIEGSRYTLKDIYMPDGDFSGKYERYSPAYRDQQNDLAQGFTYRYYVAPVINSADSPDFKYAGGVYTIGAVTYSGASALLERDGFAIGFGQDVKATKGTYSSLSGGANDRIRISWSAPPRLAATGFSPGYTVYRKAHNAPSWGAPLYTTNESYYVDNPPASGIVYEYLIGISGSQPQASSRFIEQCKTLRSERNIPDHVGYMLGMVKMNEVSRDARPLNTELVTWYSSRVDNPYSTSNNWGFDGYTIFLLNRNVNNDRQWITVMDVPVSDLADQGNQSRTVDNDANRLKVLRDYRHYYKVRSYVWNGDQKVYCPDPAPEYVFADGRNDDYVKWGARQISADEFAAITSLSIGTAMNWWADNDCGPDRDNTQANKLNIEENGNYWLEREAKFSSVKCYFVTVNGTLSGRADAVNKTPITYGATVEKYTLTIPSGTKNKLSTLTITGPDDVNGMYSGTVKIEGLNSGAGNGPYKVSYNGQNDYAVSYLHYRTCFTFSVTFNNYKPTKNFDWSPSAGITGTGNVGPNMNDKWWYPVNGPRAGWD
jgi:hypothetical protein